jgi:hypothetical protein
MKASKRRLPADTFDLQHTVGHLVRRTHQLHNLLFSQVTAGCDITSPQFAALRTIEAFPELEQNGLSEIIAYDRTTIGGLIDRLEAKGLVQRSVRRFGAFSRAFSLRCRPANARNFSRCWSASSISRKRSTTPSLVT